MEYVDPISGIYGESAKQKLKKFINEEQDNYWRFVGTMEELDLPESPFPGLRSVVVRADPPREPRPRKRRDRTPESLGSPEPIVLAEPPRKKQQIDELLKDLACTSSVSSSSSSSSSASSSSSSSSSEDESDTALEHNKHAKQGKRKKKFTKRTDEKKQIKDVSRKEKKTEKTTESIDHVGQNNTKENVKGREKEMRIVRKGTQKDNMTEKNYNKESKKINENEKQSGNKSVCMSRDDKDRQKETVKDKTNENEKSEEIMTDRSKGAEMVERIVKMKESEPEQECAIETNATLVKSVEKVHIIVENNENSEKRITEELTIRRNDDNEKVINLTESGELEKEKEQETVIEKGLEIKEKEKEQETVIEEGSEIKEKENTVKAKTSEIKEKGTEKESVSVRGIYVERVQGKENTKMKDTGIIENNNDGKSNKSKDGKKACEKNTGESVEIDATMKTEKQKSQRKENELERLRDMEKQNRQKEQKDISGSSLSKFRVQSQSENKCMGKGIKVKENSNSNSVKCGDEMPENKEPKPVEKKKVTVKEYQARKLEENKNEPILDVIMHEMTKTYANTNALSPIIDLPTSCLTETINVHSSTESVSVPILYETVNAPSSTESESVPNLVDSPDFIETVNAVASISNITTDEKYEKATNIISECAANYMVEYIALEESGSMAEQEIESYVKERVMNDQEKETSKDETTSIRIAEKRKSNEIEQNTSASKRKIHENNDENEVDKDLVYIQKVQGHKVILNIGGARFETCRLTLKKDPDSLLSKLFSRQSPIIAQGNSIFIDRDPAHFKVILNYLRYDFEVDPSSLPRERRHLLELKRECEYYRVNGLRRIVKRRLKQVNKLCGVE